MSLARAMPPWLWLILVVLYFLIPLDIFPDFLGLPGRVDDFLVALAGLYFMYANSSKRRKPGEAPQGSKSGDRGEDPKHGDPRNGDRHAGRKQDPGKRDPYEVLGVPRDAPMEEIRRRYRERLLQVHPDRVQHLGPEFQEMAERKTRELNGAFQQIERERKRNA